METYNPNNPFMSSDELKPPPGSGLVDLLQTIVVALALVVFMYLFILTPNEVRQESMRETFQDKELLLTNKMIQVFGGTQSILGNIGNQIFGDYQRGDVVIFHEDFRNDDFIKRIIGIPGDKIKILGGYVYVNGIRIDEPYLADGSIDPRVNNLGHTDPKETSIEGEEVTIPEGFYFVMGDNRNNSVDSRFREVSSDPYNKNGFVSRNNLKGRVIFRYFPFNRFGPINHIKYQGLE